MQKARFPFKKEKLHPSTVDDRKEMTNQNKEENSPEKGNKDKHRKDDAKPPKQGHK